MKTGCDSSILIDKTIVSDLILCLVTAFFLLTIIGVASMYAVKVRNISSSPRVLACNGNGHINGKRNTQVVKIGQADGQADGDCQEMEVYIPMLTQIPPDFKCTPLDTKVNMTL